MTCGQPHPERPEVRCELTIDNHPVCTGNADPDALFGDYLDWINVDYVKPKVIQGASTRALRDTLARIGSKVRPALRVTDQSEGFAAGVQGSERAATKWTDIQLAMVDAAILAVARRHSGGREFTSDAIWDELAGAVPVTKGLTARLLRAERLRIIGNTGKTGITDRGGHHDHGQRLTIWYSLLS